MRFVLVGDHPDVQAFATAAISAGHRLIGYCGSAPTFARSLSANIKVTADLEELLADPATEAVIIGSPVNSRLDVARRVLQSERSAAIAWPVDVKPDGVYELNMLQGDMHQVLLPLMPDAMIDAGAVPANGWIDVKIADPVEPLLHVDESGKHAAFPLWTLLRHLVGEIIEISGFAQAEEIAPGSVNFLNGRGDKASFRAQFQRSAGPTERRIEIMPGGTVTSLDYEKCWPQIVAEFDRAIASLKSAPRAEPAAGPIIEGDPRLSWRDAIRAAELDDAAARSIVKRRAVLLEYQEANEEVGFKGTMTLIGCGLLWVVLLLLILANWLPWVMWLILPVIVIFLVFQILGVLTRR